MLIITTFIGKMKPETLIISTHSTVNTLLLILPQSVASTLISHKHIAKREKRTGMSTEICDSYNPGRFSSFLECSV